MNVIVKKFKDGDPLTDDDLDFLLDLYTRVCNDLDMLGPEHQLSVLDCEASLSLLKSYREARIETKTYHNYSKKGK